MANRFVCLVFWPLAVVASLSACSSITPGTPAPAEIDVRTLDIGPYTADKPTAAARMLPGTEAVVEGARLADAVISPYEVDPKYIHGLGGKLEMEPDDVTVQLPEFVTPILEKYGMVMALRTAAADTDLGDGKSFESGSFEGLTSTVIRFPDEASARSAAKEMDEADFSRNADNVSVPLRDFPEAFSHWRPTVPTISVTEPHRQFVIAVYAGRHTVDKDALVEMVEKYLHAQIQSLDAFHPTPVSDFKSLPIDPDNMLTRLFHKYYTSSVGGVPGAEHDIVYSGHAFLNFQSDIPGRTELFRTGGIDRVAASDGVFLFRARDHASAKKFAIEAGAAKGGGGKKAANPVPGIPDSVCTEDRSNAYPFVCYVVYRRYVAQVKSDQLIDVHQQAAAQYALLANNQ